jgi:hypothetical protein
MTVIGEFLRLLGVVMMATATSVLVIRLGIAICNRIKP